MLEVVKSEGHTKTPNTLLVTFNQPVLQLNTYSRTDSLNPNNYKITDENSNHIPIQEIRPVTPRTVKLILGSPQLRKVAYQLDVKYVQAVGGDTIINFLGGKGLSIPVSGGIGRVVVPIRILGLGLDVPFSRGIGTLKNHGKLVGVGLDIPESFGVASVSNAPTYQAVVLADNPLVYLRCGEASGNLHNLGSTGSTCDFNVERGGATYSVTGAIIGDPDTAIYSPPAEAEFRCVDPTPIGTLADFTVEFWIKPDSVQSGTYSGVFTYSSSFGFFGFKGSSFNFYNAGDQIVAGTWVAGVWQHVVFSRVGSTLKLYVNNVLITTVSYGTALPAAGGFPLRVLSDNSGPEWYFGDLDEFALYSTGLSAARVAVHYHTAGY